MSARLAQGSNASGADAPRTAGGIDKPPSARERILAAADRLFYRDGIRAIGVEAVVEQAGVTKMSLYRNFASKDELIAAYLSYRDQRYWRWWDGLMARHPDQPGEQVRAIFAGTAKVATTPGYRGCPFTNAAIEFPVADHPGRRVAEDHKREVRRRFRALADTLGATNPQGLGDQLTLLLEGAYVSSQTFGADGPSAALVAAVGVLIAAATAPGGDQPQ